MPDSPASFDPTSPGSQILRRPGSGSVSPSFGSPFTDPDASPVGPLVSVRVTALKWKGREVSNSTPSLRPPTGKIGSEGIRDVGSVRAGSKSFVGGTNQTFMHFINALSLEDPSATSSAEDSGAKSSSSEEEADEYVEPLSALPSPISQSTRSLPGVQSSESSDDEDPPSFLSPSTHKSGKATQSKADAAEVEQREVEMTSSIFAIHRPIAARRRTETGEQGECVSEGAYASQIALVSDAENDATGNVGARPSAVASRDSAGSEGRKGKLAEKLEDIFGLDGRESVVAEFHCWLFRSVLLQGFMYLTTGHICFYAYLPKKEGAIVRSGNLAARSNRTRRYNRHWFILKDAVLAWYPSASDPYFPDGHVDLHYCTSVEASLKHDTHFKVSTVDKKWHFRADSEASRDEWIKIIKKVVFQCQNEGESVKISIPLEAVIDVERSANLEFAETIRIRVYDADEGYSVDEYWLSYFVDIGGALEQMTQVLEDFRKAHPEQAAQTAANIASTTHGSTDSSRSQSYPERPVIVKPASQTSTIRSALSTRLRLFSTSDRLTSSVSTISASPTQEQPGYFLGDSRATLSPEANQHTYPPDPSSITPPSSLATQPRHGGSWIPSAITTSVPSWLKGPPTRLFSRRVLSSYVRAPPGTRKILEFVSPSTVGSKAELSVGKLEKTEQDSAYTMLEGGVDLVEEPDVLEEDGEKLNEKFRLSFGLTEKESVVAHFPAYLFRGLPIHGQVYISSTFFCFKSAGILAKTKMILPLSEIIAVSKHRSYRIGYSGLIVVIKGHEELFFELSSSERRDDCMSQLEVRIETVQQLLVDGETPGDTNEHRNHMDLLELAASITSDSDTNPRPSPESTSGQPPVMFCSTSSDFVTFRPEKSLNFTCLTIGSRGDVQPFIALCKGLMAEGHKCKIASHGEYRSWVEGHGIAFEEVGGDPAELMQLMIAHDFFTISFMKEAVGRFRGWLDDLLETTWKACQGADVLIESPSAIAGYHIAEALRIPYYRAFTMPWSRTRAYPHAFAVPDHKMGGGYNYMTYTMFDQIFWRATAGQVNRWRKKTLNLGSTSLEAMQTHKIPFLYNFSPVIIPPPLDWRENIHVTGYWWLDNPDDSDAKKWQPPAELLAFLDLAKAEHKKVVFIGFGSIIIPDPEEMTRVVVGAVQKAQVYAIVAKGWSDRAKSKEASSEEILEKADQEEKEAAEMRLSNIFNIKSIPHDWLFPRIDAAVHHGGAGTTGASLRAGLPTIIKPFFGDQHFYADRVATLGIGSAVRIMSVDNLAAAIHTAVTDEKQISRAKLAGEAIRKEDGVGNAIECIYRDLEYARSLIPPPQLPKHSRGDSATPQPPLLASTEAVFPPPVISPIRSSHLAREASRTGSSEGDWDILSADGSRADPSASWELERRSRASSVSNSKSRTRSEPESSQGGDISGSEGDSEDRFSSKPGSGVLVV